MKLKITDDFWAVGHRTKRVKTVYAPLVVGPIKGLEEDTGYCVKKEGENYTLQKSSSSYWNIDEVGEDFVRVSYIRHDGETVKNWTITKKEGGYWHPRSMDAGHSYTIKLVKYL